LEPLEAQGRHQSAPSGHFFSPRTPRIDSPVSPQTSSTFPRSFLTGALPHAVRAPLPTQVRIIWPRAGSSGTFQRQKVLFSRIIRPWVGSSDQHRPLVFVKYVEKYRKIGKIQNQFC
jgi:hypothetical protein